MIDVLESCDASCKITFWDREEVIDVLAVPIVNHREIIPGSDGCVMAEAKYAQTFHVD